MGMTNRQLATLATRLLGVYCVIQVVASIPGILAWIQIDEPLANTSAATTWALRVQFSLTLTAYLLMAALLIWRSEWFVRLVAPDDAQATQGNDDARAVQAVLYSVVGLVVLAHALPQWAHLLYSRLHAGEFTRYDTTRFWESAVALGVELALGVALFLGSGALARFWRRLNEMNRMP